MRDLEIFKDACNQLLQAAHTKDVPERCIRVAKAAQAMEELSEEHIPALTIAFANAQRCLWIHNVLRHNDTEALVLLGGNASEHELKVLNDNLPVMIENALREVDKWGKENLYPVPPHIIALARQLSQGPFKPIASSWRIIEEVLQVAIELDSDDYTDALEQYEQNHSASEDSPRTLRADWGED